MLYDVIIVGAGIAGAALSRALRVSGRNFLLIEQARELLQVGVGLSLWPNGQEAAAALGVDIEGGLGGVPWTRLVYWSGDRRLAEFDTRTFDPQQRAPLILHRRDLHGALLSGIASENLSLGASICYVKKTADIWTVRTEDGCEFRTRFLIGADGWCSQVREKLVPGNDIQLTNYVCVRAVVKHQLPFPVGEGGEVFMRGGVRYGYFSVAQDDIYWFAFLPRKLMKNQPINDLLQESSKENTICDELIRITDPDTQIVSDIGDMKPVVSVDDSRFVLLGDAAHPMQPSFGQGAGLALEDAASLADVLQTCPSIDDVPTAYFARRRQRWRQMYAASRFAGLVQQSDFGTVRAVSLMSLQRVPQNLFTRRARRLFRNDA